MSLWAPNEAARQYQSLRKMMFPSHIVVKYINKKTVEQISMYYYDEGVTFARKKSM